MWNMTTIANGSLPKESEMESSPQPPSLETFVSSWSPVQLSSIEDLQTWLQAAFPANRSVLQESEPEPTIRVTCGLQPLNAYALFDQDTASLRTFQACLIPDTLGESSLTWPRAGIVSDGVCSVPPKWERRISAIGYGSLLPTPVVPNGGRQRNLDNITLVGGTLYRKDGTKAQMDLQTYVRLWPTPTVNGNHNRKGLSKTSGDGLATAVSAWPTPKSRDYRVEYHTPGVTKRDSPDLNKLIGGQLNPTWVEWLIGWPLEWTDLRPLAMDKFRQWCEQHGICSQKD